MYDYLRGEIAEIAPTYAVIDCGGVGYYVNISLNTYTAIQNLREAKLFVYEAIREDAYTLFGFRDKQEREMFELLISVSGVGPNTARMILSSLTVDDLMSVIASGNSGMLKSVKGIGAKTAQRIIVDLKDKVTGVGGAAAVAEQGSGEAYDEAVAALIMLGFTRAAVQKTVGKLLREQPTLKVEEIIKMALKLL
ncbi:MAG: Holliday junction branch migration protein RuvA [Candidatus Limisoma sp.]|nr:Holliday junction branch migration protein RuvA [Bacteroidales bacterium]MDY4941616.1 Holliday junction branch migration protein RuvA [Candidatus Limisoma sp.]MDD7759577.1 Holliday junction branch migration protein RuvA [Bacteroidales bacterium]MDY5893820.1 Holliday junction branch migration protein RuvA [Candidatus Limisoma sp.]MDY5900321.1 Holliday junction branch migration protein RuvA [Candidatus Limisoma sp.]